MKKNGFTLIELLVVIAIIGVLSALLMANFVGVRQRARDAQRKSDLRQIQSALELYRSDNGSYPTYSSSTLPCGTKSSMYAGNPGIFPNSPPNNTSVYMQSIPCDPLSGSTGYYYSSTGTTYSLTACLENSNDSQKDSTTYSSCTTGSYTVTNP